MDRNAKLRSCRGSYQSHITPQHPKKLCAYLTRPFTGKLAQNLRVFFQEKTSAELYQDLVTTCQQPKESAQQFLLRLLDSHNKVLFASQEEGSQFEYSQKLVQDKFIKSLETGLRDEALVTNLRPTLQGTEVSEESLMRIVND